MVSVPSRSRTCWHAARPLGPVQQLAVLVRSQSGRDEVEGPSRLAAGHDSTVAGAGQRAGAFHHLGQDGVEVKAGPDAQTGGGQSGDAVSQDLDLWLSLSELFISSLFHGACWNANSLDCHLGPCVFISSVTVDVVGCVGTKFVQDLGCRPSRQASPYGLVVDGAGNLFIADRNYHRMHRVGPAGGITTNTGRGGKAT